MEHVGRAGIELRSVALQATALTIRLWFLWLSVRYSKIEDRAAKTEKLEK